MEKDGLREREEWMSETYGCFLLREHIPQHDARTATQRAIAAVNVIQIYIWQKADQNVNISKKAK